MEENHDIPWLDEIVSNLDRRVITYLSKHHRRYSELRKQVIQYAGQYAFLEEQREEATEITLSAEQHQAYIEYLQMRDEMDDLERKYYYLLGQADMVPYITVLRQLSDRPMEGTRDGCSPMDILELNT